MLHWLSRIFLPNYFPDGSPALVFFAALKFQQRPVGGLIVTYGSPLSILIFEHHVAGDPSGKTLSGKTFFLITVQCIHCFT